MKKNYLFPIQIFIIMENVNINLWTKNSINYNFFFFFLNKKWIICLMQILKNELFLNSSLLLEISCISSNYFKQLKTLDFFSLNILLFYIFYIFNSKIKLFIITNQLLNEKNYSFFSVDKIFLNSNWLERETSEMYNISFLNKNDKRNLLLEYSKIEPVLLKDFSVEGLNDIYFSFFENQIILNKNTSIEL